MQSTRSRSLSELATLKEEDPHDLRIEDGLPPLIIETLEQPASHFAEASEQAAISEVAQAFRKEIETEKTLPGRADRAGSSSAPHLSGDLQYARVSRSSRILEATVRDLQFKF